MDRLWTRLDRFDGVENQFFSIWSLDRLDRLDTFFGHSKKSREIKGKYEDTKKYTGDTKNSCPTGPTGPFLSSGGVDRFGPVALNWSCNRSTAAVAR